MKPKSPLIGLILLPILFCGVLKAQRPNLGVHFSAMIIQGEAMGSSMLSDDVGYGFNVDYNYPLGSPRLFFTLNATTIYSMIDFTAPYNSNELQFYDGSSLHSSLGVGLTAYPFKRGPLANMYHPYRIFISSTVGGAFQLNSTKKRVNVPEKKIHVGGKLLPYFEGSLGINIRINPHTSVLVFGAGRTTLSDEIDGIIGSGAGFDIMGRIGLGLNFNLR